MDARSRCSPEAGSHLEAAIHDLHARVPELLLADARQQAPGLSLGAIVRLALARFVGWPDSAARSVARSLRTTLSSPAEQERTSKAVARYNVRDIFQHFVKPKSARGDACPHSCCRGYRIHPASLPPTLKPRILRRLSDDELGQHYAKHNDCERCRGQIERELDRRDRVDAARKATGQRNKARALERHEHVEREWLAAEAATRGNLVNARGRTLGISERSLFTGSEDRAMRYASRELLNYWETHPRLTAPSMSGSYQVRRKAAAGSNLGRQQATSRLRNGRTVTMAVVARQRRAA